MGQFKHTHTFYLFSSFTRAAVWRTPSLLSLLKRLLETLSFERFFMILLSLFLSLTHTLSIWLKLCPSIKQNYRLFASIIDEGSVLLTFEPSGPSHVENKMFKQLWLQVLWSLTYRYSTNAEWRLHVSWSTTANCMIVYNVIPLKPLWGGICKKLAAINCTYFSR